MNPWHFRQLPLLLFLTPSPPQQHTSRPQHPPSHLPGTHDRGMSPLGCAPAHAEPWLQGLWGCRGQAKEQLDPSCHPLLARPPASCSLAEGAADYKPGEKGERLLSGFSFSFFPLFKSLTAFI